MNLVAEGDAGWTESLDFGFDVVDLNHYPIPATGLGLSAVWHCSVR